MTQQKMQLAKVTFETGVPYPVVSYGFCRHDSNMTPPKYNLHQEMLNQGRDYE